MSLKPVEGFEQKRDLASLLTHRSSPDGTFRMNVGPQGRSREMAEAVWVSSARDDGGLDQSGARMWGGCICGSGCQELADELAMGSVLSYCCGNGSLQVCALQSPRSRYCQVRFSVRAPFLPVGSHLLCPHVVERVSAGGSSLSKGTNPSLGAPPSWPHLS